MRSPRLLLPTLLALGALTVTACGGGDAAGPSREAPAASGFPVTIEQRPGRVTIDREPRRVVSLDFPSTDAALALGIDPVGMSDVSYVDGGIQAWTTRALDGRRTPERLNTDSGFPFEKIAALRPDAILATNTFPLVADSWDQLNALAPVAAHVGAPSADAWQDGVRQVGKALGFSDRARDLIADVERQVARSRGAHPEFAGKTVAFFNYVPGDGLYVIADDDDPSIRFLRSLGFAGVPDGVRELGDRGVEDRAKVSPERYDLLDADVILGTSSDPDGLAELDRDRLFRRIPSVARGAYVTFGIGPATAIAFPSVLSVPYAVDELTPDLARAATAGGRR